VATHLSRQRSIFAVLERIWTFPPFRWDFSSQSPLDESSEPESSSNINLSGSKVPSSFDGRFYKAYVRYDLSKKALKFSSCPDHAKYEKWARELWYGDASSSFLEFLEALEVRDFMLGFPAWKNEKIMSMDDWSLWMLILRRIPVVAQKGVLVFPAPEAEWTIAVVRHDIFSDGLQS